jgi:hypothetical protein
MLMVGRENSIDQPHVPSSIGMKQCCLVVDFEGFLLVVVIFVAALV